MERLSKLNVLNNRQEIENIFYELLTRDLDKKYLYEYDEQTLEFIRSKYFSDMYKRIYGVFINKNLMEMNSKELGSILDRFYSIESIRIFRSLVFKLGSIGSRTLINDLLTKDEIMEILYNTIGDYTNGLNDKQKESIYKKLLLVNKKYAKEYKKGKVKVLIK